MKTVVSGCIQNPQRLSHNPSVFLSCYPLVFLPFCHPAGIKTTQGGQQWSLLSNSVLITWKCLEKMGFIDKRSKNLTFGVVFARFSKACLMNMVSFPEQGRIYENFANIYFLNIALFHPYAVSHGCFTLG